MTHNEYHLRKKCVGNIVLKVFFKFVAFRCSKIIVSICKDTFKSLREKYLREREKAQNQSIAWEFVDHLKFLDPHIVPRASMWNGNALSEDEQSIMSDSDPTDFDKHLIEMVKKASPIWDRNSNSYPSKTSKNQLWEDIASSLHKDINSCMLRWKALREKYIRQKAKFQEGESKWELLDDLSFLDNVIQYRRKQNEIYSGDSMPGFSRYNNNYRNPDYIKCNESLEDHSYTDSSNDFLAIVKEENTVQQMADSSFPSPNYNKRFRQNSVSSYGEEKKLKPEESETKDKTPEQLFGDLVASLLAKKPESQRNLYMIEIMTVLSK
ncbi:unnamed protein product [Ceutorhynchus assimilis]|uniref:MADF domain-containing protein n=1 Tax=Ceutorhynchus assimilis TaxID=467358 RepID=A0A9P0DD88_9CUCU|nr:unnamed protein product [Ceutorhynchus assimilis]